MRHSIRRGIWLIYSVLLLTAGPVYAQAPFVDALASGHAGHDIAWGLALDAQGNVYAAGNGNQATLSKRSPAGTAIFAVAFGNGGTTPYGLAIDGNGGIAVVGSFSGQVDFDPGPAVQSLDAAAGSVFVARFVGNGELAWVGQFHGDNAHTQAVAVDASGALFVTGSGGGTHDFDPGPGVADLNVLGAWLVKLDVNGQYQWAKTIEAFPYALETVASTGAVVWVGDVSGPFDLDPGPGVSLAQHVGSADAFVVKLDGAGQFVWGHAIGSSGLDEGVGLGVDSAGNVVLSGYGGSPMDLDPGPGTILASGNPFVVSLDSNGQFRAGVRLQPAGRSWWFDAAFDAQGNFYVTGDLDGSMDADPGPDSTIVNGGPSPDAFIASYTATGAFRWAATAGNPNGSEVGIALASAGNRVAASSAVFGSADFNPGAGVTQLTSVDSADAVAWIFSAGGAPINQAVFVADYDGSIVRLAPDGSNRQTILSGLGSPTALAYDADSEDLYFTQSADNLIRRSEPDGTGMVTLMTTPSRPYGLALHPAAGKMYWSEDVNTSIWRANLDGTQQELILGAPHVVGPTGLWIDVPNNHLYWADYHGGFVGRARLDGSQPVVLVPGRSAPNHVAVDVADGKLFWTESGNLMRANLDGSGVTPMNLALVAPTGIGLDLAGDRLYVGNELGTRVSFIRADDTQADTNWATGFGRPIGVLYVDFDAVPEPQLLPTVRLLDSVGNGLAGAVVSYYDAGWKPFGITGADGKVAHYVGPGSYTFRVEFGGASVQKVQNIGTIPLVDFQTRDVVVHLRDSVGNPLDPGTAEYYGNGWKPIGVTSAGQVHKELLPASYTFAMSYAGARVQKVQNISSDPVVVFQTLETTVHLRDSAGNPLDPGVAEYYASGWKAFGTTASGEVRKQLLPASYTFAMSHGGARVQKAQNVSSDALVVFQTRDVVVALRDSAGNPLDPGTAEYYASSWKPFGTTVAGVVHKELLGASYTFAMNFAGARVQRAQDVAIDALVVFQTRDVVVELRNSAGNPLDTGVAEYYANGWKPFGTTTGGSVHKELLAASYTFAISHAGGRVQKAQNVSSDPVVVFQTGAVVSTSATCTDYYANGWRVFTQGMQLLPMSYSFRFSSGTPSQQSFAITAGVQNDIR